MISLASAIEQLTLAINEQRHFELLANSIRSLQKLKVAGLHYVGNSNDHSQNVDATGQFLICASSCCKHLEELKLLRIYIRKLPAQLSSASRLTLLVLSDPEDTQLSIAADAMPCSLQQLQLTEKTEDAGLGPHYYDAITMPLLPGHLADLISLQHLQITMHHWAHQCLPRLKTLRLEAPAERADSCHHGELLGGVSSLVSLEQLHFKGFKQLDPWPADVSNALQPLCCLRALGFDMCGLREVPATAVLSRLSLLNLRNNGITTLANALPAGAVQNLRVLDLSGNALGRPLDACISHWTDANMAAFSGNWESLQVLGVKPPVQCNLSSSLKTTVKTLSIMLRRQATTAQPPRRPPVVVYSHLHQELLRPADELAVVE